MPKTTLDIMMEAAGRYANAKEIVGTALYRIELMGIPLADAANKIRLDSIYSANKKEIDYERRVIQKAANRESSQANSKGIASVLVDSFHGAFKELYVEWRSSLDSAETTTVSEPSTEKKAKRKKK